MCGREEGDAALEAIKQKLMDRGVAEHVADQQLSTEVQLLSRLAAAGSHVIQLGSALHLLYALGTTSCQSRSVNNSCTV